MKKEEVVNENENINADENTNKEVEVEVTVDEDTSDDSADTCEDNGEDNSCEEAEKDPLAEAQAQIEELKKQMLYKVAEFENFRKRTLAEKTELILNGGQKVITAILPVLDDMERAIANASKAESTEALEEGWELIAKKLNKILEGQGVQKIDTTDADFNTDYHEAIALVPGMGDEKKGKVIDCVEAGYTLNDKVIRHAKVAVGQ